MTIVCAAVVGQLVSSCSQAASQRASTHCSRLTLHFCVQNNPLYVEAFQTSPEEDALKFHHIVHCSLDAVEEKCKLIVSLAPRRSDPLRKRLKPLC